MFFQFYYNNNGNIYLIKIVWLNSSKYNLKFICSVFLAARVTLRKYENREYIIGRINTHIYLSHVISLWFVMELISDQFIKFVIFHTNIQVGLSTMQYVRGSQHVLFRKARTCLTLLLPSNETMFYYNVHSMVHAFEWQVHYYQRQIFSVLRTWISGTRDCS